MKELAMRTISALTLTAAMLFPAAAEQSQRYTLERTESGFVRMDTATGALSTCVEKEGELVCRLAADDRDAYDADIQALEKRIADLEAMVAGIAPGVAGEDKTTSAEDFDTAMDQMEGFFRRFMGIMKEFQGEAAETPSAPGAQPDRT
jgi:hypothetical protein